MATTEQVIGGVIVAALLGLAGFFGRRQVRVLRAAGEAPGVSAEDRAYVRRQAWRRLTCSGLMVLLAGLLIGWYWLGVNNAVLQLLSDAQAGGDLQPDQRRTLNWLLVYIIAVVAILLVLLVLALFDVLAIRRFGMRHYRQIQADRRAMIEQEVSRLRGGRNGQH
jgi:hypothetical protein